MTLNIPTLSSLAVAVCLTSALACPSSVGPVRTAAAEGPTGRVALVRFRAGTGSFSYYSGLTDSLRVVIRDSRTWRQYWAAIHADLTAAPPLPNVDFTRDAVLLASAGRRGSGGYAIVIDSATSAAGTLHVYIRELVPGRGCVVNAVVTSPVDIARVSLRADTVMFVSRVERESCE